MACQGAIRYQAGELIEKAMANRSLEKKIDRAEVLLEKVDILKRIASIMNGFLEGVTLITKK